MGKLREVFNFINTCPLVGYDMYFNFVDETKRDSNTSLITDGYGHLVKRYGEEVKKIQCIIRQTKPFTEQSNTNENVEQQEKVQEFLDWINEQGKQGNFPDFGEGCKVIKLATPDGVIYPMEVGVYNKTTLYSFPFEITYTERM